MEVILIGGFIEVIELCELCNIKITGIIDDKLKEDYCGYPIIGNDADAPTLFDKYGTTPLILSPDAPATRKKIADYYESLGYTFISLISPKAEVSKSVIRGKGVIIQTSVNVSANTRLGNFVRLNTKSNIMHDCTIDDYTTIAPSAVVLGRVNIGKYCYIGANATILPEINIGDGSIIGAGAVVVKDIENNKTVKGIPAK